MFRVTTAPAPTTTLSVMVTGMIVALVPMETLSPMTVARQILRFPCAGPPTREGVVDEHDSVGNKAVGPYFHQFAHERMGLYPAIVPDFDAPLDLHERPYEAVVADGAFVEVYRFHDRYVLSERDVPDFDFPDSGQGQIKLSFPTGSVWA